MIKLGSFPSRGNKYGFLWMSGMMSRITIFIWSPRSQGLIFHYFVLKAKPIAAHTIPFKESQNGHVCFPPQRPDTCVWPQSGCCSNPHPYHPEPMEQPLLELTSPLRQTLWDFLHHRHPLGQESHQGTPRSAAGWAVWGWELTHS